MEVTPEETFARLRKAYGRDYAGLSGWLEATCLQLARGEIANALDGAAQRAEELEEMNYVVPRSPLCCEGLLEVSLMDRYEVPA